MRGRILDMDRQHQNALVAILARIDEQILDADALLLKSLTVRERTTVNDELAYLQIERLGVTAKLQSKK